MLEIRSTSRVLLENLTVNSFLFRRKAHKTVSFVVFVLVWFLLKPVARPISRLLYEISPKVGEPSPASSS